LAPSPLSTVAHTPAALGVSLLPLHESPIDALPTLHLPSFAHVHAEHTAPISSGEKSLGHDAEGPTTRTAGPRHPSGTFGMHVNEEQCGSSQSVAPSPLSSTPLVQTSPPPSVKCASKSIAHALVIEAPSVASQRAAVLRASKGTLYRR
jgi:hypothetical protein